MKADWVTELLDLGIGALAAKYLYLIKNKAMKSTICPHCYTQMRKFAHRCPTCRRDLPWVSGIEII